MFSFSRLQISYCITAIRFIDLKTRIKMLIKLNVKTKTQPPHHIITFNRATVSFPFDIGNLLKLEKTGYVFIKVKSNSGQSAASSRSLHVFRFS